MHETILSDSEINDDIAMNLIDFSSYFSINKFTFSSINLSSDIKPRLSCLSAFLPAVKIFSYDNPDLLSKFPEGIITESLILIPSDKLTALRLDFCSIQEPNRFYKKFTLLNNDHKYAFFFAKPILEFLEFNLNVQLTALEQQQLINDLNEFSSKENSYKSLNQYFSLNPVKITNDFLLSQIDNKNLSLHSYLEEYKSFNKTNQYLMSWLKQNDFSKFPTIQNAIFSFNDIDVNSNISIEDFNKLYFNKYNDLEALLILNKKFAECKANLELQNNEDFNLFMSKSSEHLFPFLSKSPTNVFRIVFSSICQELFPQTNSSKYNPSTDYLSRKDLIAGEIYHKCLYSDIIRNHLIKIITDFDFIEKLQLDDDKKILASKLNQNSKSFKVK